MERNERRLVSWVVRIWRCLIEVHGVEQEERRNYEYTGLCYFLLHAETPEAPSPLPIITFDIVA